MGLQSVTAACQDAEEKHLLPVCRREAFAPSLRPQIRGHVFTFPKMSVMLGLLLCCVSDHPVIGFSMKNCRIGYSQNITINMSIICSQNNLKVVPDDIPAMATFLDLAKNNISQIRNLDFKNVAHLKALNLSRNQISHVANGAFVPLEELEQLNLANNKLTILSDHMFQGLVNLFFLQLYRNNITVIESSTFQFLSRLEALDLSSNHLRTVQKVQPILQCRPHLKELYIGNNSFTSFQSWEIANTSLGLQVLDISENPLEVFRITADIFPNLVTLNLDHSGQKKDMIWDVQNKSFLRNVTSLNLSGVRMSLEAMSMILHTLNSSLTCLRLYDLVDNIGAVVDIACRIPTLTSLLLRDSKIGVVSWDLLHSCSLVTWLDFTHNKIRNVSENSFRSMQHLSTLMLSHNSLSSVPRDVRNITTLKTLRLIYNNISRLGCSDFANLTQLRELSVSYNRISDLQACVFRDLKELEILSLSGNCIQTLGDVFGDVLPNLMDLSLNSNNLHTIHKGNFRSLKSLTHLSLFDNHIDTLEAGAFEGLANLTELLLEQNQIESEQIRGDVFGVLRNLKYLNLVDNKLNYKTGDPISPPFTNLTSLENLLIFSQRHRLKSHLPPNFLTGLTNLLVFKARNIRITSLNPVTFKDTPHLKSLEINSNDLLDLPPELFHPIPKLERLFVSLTRLQSLDFLIRSNLTQLSLLQARHNEFPGIKRKVLDSLPALTYLDIKGNLFSCDCNNAWFLEFAENSSKTQVVDAHNYLCTFPADLKGSKLLDFDVHSCSVDVGFSYYISTTCVVLLVQLASLTFHLLRWQVVYAYYLFLAFVFNAKQKNRRAAHQYDAFVSYNIHDEPWVLGELLPKLEEERGWKLCLHHRDFQPGRAIIDNITDAIYGSRKTICVISRHYLESEWCSREIQVASFRLFDEQKDVLILVFLEEIPAQQLSPYHRMRKLLKRRTYLSWPRAGQNTGLFWHKLHLALQTREGPAEENPLLTGMERL